MNTSDQQDKYLLSVISRTDGTRKSADNLSNLEEVKEAVSELVVCNDN